ncbi:MAG: precorrin-6A synthase (deacetylating) [Propionibacteriaceae bacterium]
MARELILIGIGAGDPNWVTMEAVQTIKDIDVLFVVLKEDEYDDLVEARRVVIERHRDTPLKTVELRDPKRPWRTAPDYKAAVKLWREQRRELWSGAIADHLSDGGRAGFLIWGDPSLYESTLAIVQEVQADEKAATGSAFSLRVIPGISCVLALAARHQIPLNRQGKGVQITPARLLQEGLPEGMDDAVVMLDGKQTFSLIDPTGIDIYWGAYLGTADEILISGPLEEVRDQILQTRAEAAKRKGWMFDTYLLRRR